ncbi:4-amino-4-deoxy-L-arabinose-phosphoundecaprenol flippase subunit ArnF [Intestinirhabdus alba]|jgi:undecaprenyl phosphate-alpha-L-ara4N flippase subunit ArnF|uniref:Probable 4-amino-4-deoxy-L-arabinose-phosphoundecaprenol flippase subunit ArnF n=1 Tax=Intestinirhabdus alba TaxID=2899544 RepID=A0A6L6IMS9_9ENTR|nr:4-amino-4-deoxy-L-arabinose-phosphoundecaprenol flippase subunit ArnF [Intestinirhabdus alba]MTH47197.1 4-amino-4-deoxy-L-arabinose-phospho-UDP flippase [Intestinirhabdus alba]
MGYLWALISVLLVSGAQLGMKWAMLQLPPLSWDWGYYGPALLGGTSSLVLLAGLAAYGLSMVCWYLALRKIALSHAYPLLSLSYVLVWVGAICLPWLHERFSQQKFAGAILIFLGLLLIFLPGRRGASANERQ